MKYALVTGGSRGIGREICIRLAQMGYYVLVNYLSNKEAAEETLSQIRKIGSDGELMQFDVADATTVSELLEGWQASHKDSYIEVLVNNAGVREDNLMWCMTSMEWNSVLNTHLGGFFNVTQPLLKLMLFKKYGRIINITSLSGIKGMAGQVNYSAAKGGLIAATKALALEVAKKKVTVNAVAPGFITTDMTEGLDESVLKKLVPVGRFGEAKEVADLVAFLASENSSYITGEVISINGGLYT